MSTQDTKQLAENNEKMKKMVDELRESLKTNTERLEQMVNEQNSSIRILWAAAHSLGGELRIPDSSMIEIDTDCELETGYDSDKKITFFKAKKKKQLNLFKLDPSDPPN